LSNKKEHTKYIAFEKNNEMRTILRNKYAEANGEFEEEFEELNFITSDDTEIKNIISSNNSDK
jgi:CHASE3 domain sensor protein